MSEPSDVYRAQGFGHSLPPGPRSALLIIDFANGFADPQQFGGGNIASAIECTKPLLAEARRRALPICFSRIVYDAAGADFNVFQMKIPSLKLLTEESPLSAIVDALRPLPGELVIRKQNPSAFFGTGLAPWLVQRQVDNLIVTGCTTSGCVRASVVDAMSFNFRCYIVEDCVGDRSFEAHRANLFDMQQKYGDVCSTDFALALLQGAQDLARAGVPAHAVRA